MPESDSTKSRSKKPVSEKQLAANRANAAGSTGPKTPEGRANSSRNAVKHDFASANYTVVRLEDVQEVARLRADLIAVYQPVNSQELFALEQMALRQQAMLRAARFEAGLFSACLNECLESDGSARFPLHEDVTYGIEVTLAQNRNYMLADGFFRLARQSNGIQLFLRYQAQAERLYRRAVEEFERVRKLRPELPNEPISLEDESPEPAENSTGSTGDLAAGPSPNEPISSPPLRPGTAGDRRSGSACDVVTGLSPATLPPSTACDLGAGASPAATPAAPAPGTGHAPGAATPGVILGKCASRTAATQLRASDTPRPGA